MLLPLISWFLMAEDRLEEVLPSGATIMSECMPKAETVSIAIVGKAEDTPETVQTHGWRHLLEHIVAKGPHKDLDKRLEAVGGFLYAQTNRDTLCLRLDAPIAEATLAQKLGQEIVSPLRTTDAEIQIERRVIREEIALTSPGRLANIAAWTKVYGGARLDPLGDVDAMGKASVKGMENLFASTFCTKNLVVCVCGPDTAERSLEIARSIAENAIKAPEVSYAEPEAKDPTPVYAEVGDAVAVGVPVQGFFEKATVAKVVAGHAFAAQGRGEFFFTPSGHSGLISCAFWFEADLIRAVQTPPDQGLYQLGVLRTRNWIRSQLRSAGPCAQFRATLMATSPFYRPEGFLDELELVSYDQFAKAYKQLAEAGK